MLCKSCTSTLQEIFAETEENNRYKRIIVHEKLQDLQTAAQDDCFICFKLFETLEAKLGPALLNSAEYDKPIDFQVPPPPFPKPSTLFFDLLYISDNFDHRWFFCLVPLSMREDNFGFELDNIPSGNICAKHKLYRNIRSSTSSPEVGALARTWYEQCRKEHGSNCGPAQRDFFPPRVLDVTQSPPRLVLREEAETASDFAALSHCWGQERFLTLDQSNMQDLLAGKVAQENIPRNFRDAIEVCRWLRIRYLWIDSLCIIQNGDASRQDWERHVQIMGQVYVNSAVCISTAAAAGATESCFQERNVRSMEPTVIFFNGNPYIVSNCDNTIRGIQDTPIATRAWVFQERMLSKRVLTLGRQQILWECHETEGKNICETFPSGSDAPYMSRGPFSLPQDLPDIPDPRRSLETREQWQDLIKTYTALQLKFQDKDKLAALAGIAEHMHHIFGGPEKSSYVAGIFDFELPAALLWYIEMPEEPQSRPESASGLYRAPSWSWAASNTRVKLCKMYEATKHLSPAPEDHLAEVIACSVTPADPLYPYGQLHHASLRLRAYLLPFSWDASIPRIVTNRLKTYSMPGSKITNYPFSTCFDSKDDYKANGDNSFFLPIQKNDFHDYVEGLIVCPLPLREGQYRRIGMANLNIDVEVFFAWLKQNGTQEIVLV